MLELIAVFVAGGTGACFRLLLGRWVDLLCAPHLPNAGILAANLLGSLAIGFGSALLGALIVGLTGWIGNGFIGEQGRYEVVVMRREERS